MEELNFVRIVSKLGKSYLIESEEGEMDSLEMVSKMLNSDKQFIYLYHCKMSQNVEGQIERRIYEVINKMDINSITYVTFNKKK
jgi:hypothetical protein